MPGMHRISTRTRNRRAYIQSNDLRTARARMLQKRSTEENPQDPDQSVNTKISHQELVQYSRLARHNNHTASESCLIM